LRNFRVVNHLPLILLVILTLSGCESDGAKSETVNFDVIEQNVSQVLVPAGEFIRGSNKKDDLNIRERYGFPAPLYLDERPKKKIHLDAFKIDVYEVTNKQYKTYIMETRKVLPYLWMSNGYVVTEKQLGALPVSSISWFAAKAHCEWRNSRLPSEAEWEKAARGSDGLEFPWGNQWDPKITNTGDDGNWDEGVAPVGSYKNNLSPYGAYDMAGNVWEWVEDWYEPYDGSEYKVDAFGQKNRVLRGGGGGVGHYAISYFFLTATRQFSEPEMESEDVGFRCVSVL